MASGDRRRAIGPPRSVPPVPTDAERLPVPVGVPPAPVDTTEPQATGPSWPARVLIGIAGIVLLLPVAVGAFFTVVAFYSSADPPSPFSSDGYMCCGRPDTWGEVGLGLGATMLIVAATLGLLLLAARLVTVALGTRRVGRRLFLWVPTIGGLIVPVLAAATIVPRLDEARVAPDCDTFRPDRRSVQVGGSRAHERTLLGLDHCDTLIGRSLGEVRAEFGPTEQTERTSRDGRDGVTYLGQLAIEFEDDRVTSTRIWAPDSFD